MLGKNISRRYKNIIIFFGALISIFIVSGCMDGISNSHSQWRGEVDNQNRLAGMYAASLPLCDGKNKSQHKTCIEKIRHEYATRFADRYRAYYTAKSAEQLLATAIVISYVSDAMNNDTQNSSKRNTTNPQTCKMVPRVPSNFGGNFSSQLSFAVNLKKFNNFPVKCR
ncbi:hypothetical protein OAV15_03405 [Amylibacter sp.]|nr:hypothetical protein [Amylibacter sp.]